MVETCVKCAYCNTATATTSAISATALSSKGPHAYFSVHPIRPAMTMTIILNVDKAAGRPKPMNP